MAKNGVFKKIAALTAAVAMMASFALCASAASVQTTTQYVNGTQEINVIASVSGVGGGAEVTYYATNGTNKVYIDQTTASDEGEAEFNYVTNATNLVTSEVLVGYTGATAAIPDDDNLPGYTITGTGITAHNVPTENINGTHVLDYALEAGKIVKGVAATGATVSNAIYADGKLTVTLAGATGDVVLNVTTEDAATHYYGIQFLDAALIVSDGTQDEIVEGDQNADVHANNGDRKLSVLAAVTDAEEFGILVSTEEIKDSVVVGELDENIAFKALGANDSGYFAVQLIDTDADGSDALLQTGVDYYTAVYYKHPATNTYYITAGETVQAPAVAN